jgi:hypothetical protein
MFVAMGAFTRVGEGVLAGVVVVVVVLVVGAVAGVVFLLFLAVPFCARAMATGENRRSRKIRRSGAGPRWRSEAVMCCITADFRIVCDKMGFSK